MGIYVHQSLLTWFPTKIHSQLAEDFLAQADVEYVPVPRSGEKDPTDEAIIDHMSRLKQNAAVKRVALLSSDAGFREAGPDVAVGQNQWYHFGVGAPPILVYFGGD